MYQNNREGGQFVEFDKIIETIRKIIRSDGPGPEKLKRIWDYLEAVEKKAKRDEPSQTCVAGELG